MESASENSNLIPVFSREMTMEARFTFNSPTSTLLPTGNSTSRTSSGQSAADSSKSPKRESQWHWNDGGAHCSVECGRSGLSLQYESSPLGYDKSTYSTLPRQSKILQPRSDWDSFRLQPPSEPPRHHVARPYERRCKSTAQITLKQVDETASQPPKAKACEFHGSTDHESVQKKQLSTQPSHCCACSSALIHNTSNHQELCSCLHCATLQKLVRTLTHHDCYNNVYPAQTSPPSTSNHSADFRSYRELQSFNSHQKYQPPSNSVCRKEKKLDSSCGRPRETTPMPTSRSPSPFERSTNKGSRQDTSEKKKDHSKRTRAIIHSKSKSRPKTIHIDVYCSTSSSSEGDISDQMSDSSDGSILTEGRRPSRALLSLGSKKNNKKSDFVLCPRDDGKSNGTMRPGSFVYRSKNRRDSPTVPAFMTDHPLSLCSSSPPLERPASSPPTVTLRNESPHVSSGGDAIALTYPMKPTTLPLSPLYTSGYPPRNYPGTPPGRERAQSHRRTGSWESGSALSGHSSTLNYLDPFFRQNVDVSSIYDEFASFNIKRDLEEKDESEMPWRSPKLERRKYLEGSRQKVTDNLDKRRNYRDSTCSSEEITQKNSKSSTIQSDNIRTPTEVSELAKMSMFKDFSEEELQVISKSLTKRESERSQSSEKSGPVSRHSSFTFPRSGSFHDYADEFVSRQTDTHSSRVSTLNLEPCEATDTVKKKKDDSSHLFRKSYENTKLVKFMDVSVNKMKNQPSTQQSPDDKPESGKSPKFTRPINVGLFRRINRFPFNAVSHPSPRGSGVYSQLRVNDPRFTRPHVFGEALVRANRRQGIHFGPPRNPQCSCLNCLSHFRPDQNNLLGCRLKSQSLSDLNPAVSPTDHSPE